MKRIIILLFFPILLSSQVNFSEHISPIIYNNCTECHRVGQSGPMPFTNYLEVASLGNMINYVTSIDYMPPWHADTEYSTFLGERGLTDGEKNLINEWVSNGMPQGNPDLEAPIPNFPEGSVIGEPDEVFTMEEAYLIEGNNQDDYRVFVFETNFSEDKYLESIEIIPGNYAAVHHVLVNIDTEGSCAYQDALTPEYGYECESGFCIGQVPQFAAGYTPGMVPPIWSNDIGMLLPAGADIAIQMHYAPSPIDQYDQSSVNLFFKEEPVLREIQVNTLIDIQLLVPANEIYEHYVSYEVDEDISLISILPHMHLIGKSWLVYAENNGDTIPIISIPDWDFNWQTFYQPEYMLKIPQGYTIHAYATYDNTSSNPLNPNSPPQDIPWCDYTTCEMFFLPYAYVEYQEGDENIYLGNSEDLGCTDSNACNYNSEAIIEDGTCGVLDDCGECHTPCCFDLNTYTCDYSVSEQDCENFWADFDIVSDPEQNVFWNTSCFLGCTDSNAYNYNPQANIDDGSCDYGCEELGLIAYMINCDGGTWQGEVEWSIIGIDGAIVASGGAPYNGFGCFNSDQCYVVNMIDSFGDGWNGNILDLNGQLFTFTSGSFSSEFFEETEGSCEGIVFGCTDPEACNYDPLIFPGGFDDGSCVYVDGICDSCENGVVTDNDADDDGICDGDELEGCTDPLACNYNELVTDDDGSCEYAENYYDCDGNCLQDLDEDGICDECNSYENVIVDCECGFLDPATYTVFYTYVDEENCIFIEDCYCECISDIDLDNICDENDNCPDIFNPNQEDSNNDGVGDLCDEVALEENMLSKKLVKITDILGREIKEDSYYTIKLYIYNDGDVIKVFSKH